MQVSDTLYNELNPLFIKLGRKYVSLKRRRYGSRVTAEDFAQECWVSILESEPHNGFIIDAIRRAKKQLDKYTSNTKDTELKSDKVKEYDKHEKSLIKQIEYIAKKILSPDEYEAFQYLKSNKTKDKNIRTKQYTGYSYDEIEKSTSISKPKITRIVTKLKEAAIGEKE